MNRRIRDEFYSISRKFHDMCMVPTELLSSTTRGIIFISDFSMFPFVYLFRFTAADTTRIKPGSIRNVDRGKYTLKDLI